MVELGELEKHATEFEKRNTRIVVASLENVETAAKTQADFPHLQVVADPTKSMSEAFQVVHEGVVTPDNNPADVPTTFLIDGNGNVRWLFRPTRYLDRLSPQELLAAVDQHFPKASEPVR